MTVTIDSFIAVPSCAPAAAGTRLCTAGMPYSLAASSSQARESIQTMGGEGLLKHSHKRFGNGIDANVWPLSPQECSSG